MLVFKKVKDLQEYLQSMKAAGLSIGFAPTMGALHQGHLSLIQASKEANDVTVSSIFVNPTQFNEQKDLEKYPRTPEQDIALLSEAQCDVLLMPTSEDIYPSGINTKVNINLGSLTTVMEGKFRPGHFEGMMQVVKRLLDIVTPDNLYMGQKDYQQQAIVRQMINTLGLPVILHTCPTLREDDGLAMSSRNTRLDEDARRLAPLISHTLLETKAAIDTMSLAAAKLQALDMLNIPEFDLEYFEIVDGYSLESLSTWEDAQMIVACVALKVGEIRLIDNMILKEQPAAVEEF